MRRPASATHALTLTPLSKEAWTLSPQRGLSFHSGLPLMYVFIKLFHMIGLISFARPNALCYQSLQEENTMLGAYD